MAALGLREQDLLEKFIHSSGPGGQRVNKTASCVYLKHLPTGLEVKMQQERQQRLNRYYARKRMCEILEEKTLGEKSPAALKAEKIRKQKQRRRHRRIQGEREQLRGANNPSRKRCARSSKRRVSAPGARLSRQLPESASRSNAGAAARVDGSAHVRGWSCAAAFRCSITWQRIHRQRRTTRSCSCGHVRPCGCRTCPRAP